MAITKLKKLLGDGGAGLDASVVEPKLLTFLQAVVDELADVRAKFDAHTHQADGAQASTYNTSRPQSDTETVAQVTASTITQFTDKE